MWDTLERIARRSVCAVIGHRPRRVATKGYIDRVELVPAVGRRTVPVRTVAEIDHCRRCPARRLVLDPRPMHYVDRHFTRWVMS